MRVKVKFVLTKVKPLEIASGSYLKKEGSERVSEAFTFFGLSSQAKLWVKRSQVSVFRDTT